MGAPTGPRSLRSVAVMRALQAIPIPLIAALVGVAAGEASAAYGGPDPFGYSFTDQDDGAV